MKKGAVLAGKGANVIYATLDDIDILRNAAANADAVIHTAFNHDFSKFAENAEQDRRVIEALGEALIGSNRPLIVTSGLAGVAPEGVATEVNLPNPASFRKSEEAARKLSARGVRATTIRLAPSVHGLGDYGFIPIVSVWATTPIF